jgi:hypothetical protein
MKLPLDKVSWETVESSEDARLKTLTDFFGQMLFFFRDTALDITGTMIRSEDARKRIGRLQAAPFAAVSTLDLESQKACLELCKESVDEFCRLLVAYLDHEGDELELTDRYVARFKLIIEICDRQSDAVVAEEVLNRRRPSAFARSWSRWMRQAYERKAKKC